MNTVSAADDAAGVAIASRLTAEIRGTNQAIRNAMDAQALIDTAEGAHQEIEFLLQRMRELAVQSATDTNGTSDRTALQSEVTALTAEIDRIANVTSWAGIALLDGASANAAQTTETGNKSLTFHIGATGNGTLADSANPNKVVVNIGAMGSTALGIAGAGQNPTSLLEMVDASTLIAISNGNTITVSAPAESQSVQIHIDGTTVTVPSRMITFPLGDLPCSWQDGS